MDGQRDATAAGQDDVGKGIAQPEADLLTLARGDCVECPGRYRGFRAVTGEKAAVVAIGPAAHLGAE